MSGGYFSHQSPRLVERRQQVAARYLRGEYQSQIARDLGLTQAQISLDLKAVKAEWLQSTLRDFDALKGEQLAKIDAIELEAWTAYERSKQIREITITEATEGHRAGRKATMRKENQVGDPRFLERIQKCIEQRCTLLGLNAPTQLKIDWDSLSLEQLRRLALGEQPLQILAEA